MALPWGGSVTKRMIGLACLVLAAAFFCLHALAVDAEAARFGGGGSFGGRSSYTRPAPAPRTTQQQQGMFANRQTQAQNPAAGAARPGFMGSGFRGMLGGLLAGSLLGALLFGGPYSGFGIMDIVLIALVAFLGLKLLRAFMSRRTAEDTVGGAARSGEEFTPRANPWQGLRDSGGASADAPEGPDIRIPGFDREDFLRGAKMLFSRLQESWDKRDIEDIASFTTPAILNEVKAQAEADPDPSRTEIMLVNANLVSVERDGGEDVATVYFDVLLRENQEAQTPSQVRELWHFTRPSGSTEPWRLDGIQQVQ